MDKFNEIISALRKITENKWTPANSGNFSFLDKDENFTNRYIKHFQSISLNRKLNGLTNYNIIFSASTFSFGEIEKAFHTTTVRAEIPDDASEVRIYKSSDSLNIIITTEYLSHLYLYNYLTKNELNQSVVVHVHIPEFIAITHHLSYKSSISLTDLVWSVFPEARHILPHGIYYVSYQKPGSQLLADKTIENYSAQELIVWEKHGVLAVADSFKTALNILETATEALKIFFLCRNAGFYPEDIEF